MDVPPSPQPLSALPGWALQDAKARLSELVRSAQSEGPQRITLHGRDAVVVVAADDYALLAPESPIASERSLYDVVMQGPFVDDDGEFDRILEELRVPAPARPPPDLPE